jgi:hypothetical protein
MECGAMASSFFVLFDDIATLLDEIIGDEQGRGEKKPLAC